MRKPKKATGKGKAVKLSRRPRRSQSPASPTPRCPISEIDARGRFRKDYGDLDALAASIDARGGLLHPIAVFPMKDGKRKLIAGERRLKAWPRTKFGKAGEPIPYNEIDVDNLVAAEWDENAPGIRKDFTLSEAVAIKHALEPALKAKAAERQRTHTAAPGEKGVAADQVARIVGMDRKTLAKAEAVVAAASEDPDRYGDLLEQMDRTGRAHGPFNRLVNMRQAEQIKKEPPAMPGKGPYRTGSIDCPWASEPDGPSPSETGRGYYKYPTMNTAELIEFGDKVVPLLDPRGGHFWFWVTNFHLINGHAKAVLDGWSEKAIVAGIGPIKILGKRTWVKNVMGRGQVFRGQTEDVLLCSFGKAPPALAEILSTRLDGDVRGDSEKPDQFYRDVETATPASRYFELFARRLMPENWDGFGDQVGTLGDKPKHVAEPRPLPPPIEQFDDEVATALHAIEQGRPVDAKAIKRLKLVDVGYVSLAGARPKLKAAGKNLLASRREARDRDTAYAARLAELPDGLPAIIADYVETVQKHNVAVLGGNHEAEAELAHRLDALEDKANGGRSFGKATDESDAEQLRLAVRAPIGEVPAWAGIGMFMLDVAGTSHLITWDQGSFGFGCRAVDPDKPFLSETGYRGFACGIDVIRPDDQAAADLGDDQQRLPAMTVDEFCRRAIERYLATSNEDGKRAKPAKLAIPETVYTMLDAWPRTLDVDPKEISARAARKRLKEAVAAAAIEGIDPARVKAGNMVEVDEAHVVAAGFLTDDERAACAPPAEPTLPLAVEDPPVEVEAEAAVTVRACDIRKELDAPVFALPQVEVRIDSHPALYEAFDSISHDAGAGAGYACYPVPTAWAADLGAINLALSELSSTGELETLSIGEQSDQDAIASRSGILGKAHTLLSAFGRGWWKRDDEPPPATGAAEDNQLDIPAFLRRTA